MCEVKITQFTYFDQLDISLHLNTVIHYQIVHLFDRGCLIVYTRVYNGK